MRKPHTITVKHEVYQALRGVRFDFSDEETIVSFSDTIEKLIEIYLTQKSTNKV